MSDSLPPRYTLGIDYGTESGRIMLVRLSDGEEAACAVVPYPHGVLDERLPDGRPLGPEWALQHPDDYLRVLREGIPAVLRQAGARADEVAGLGLDFTACTILPTLRDGTPLCLVPAYASEPNAWVKLWKHHAAQPQADRVNEVGAAMRPERMRVYGGRVSSEWLLPKTMQILDEAPAVYAAADRILEGGDWVVWQLTGQERRNACAAGYKAMWVRGEGYPDAAFLRALHPGLERLVEEKLDAPMLPPGSMAGRLTARWAGELGLPEGLPIAVGHVDAHAAVPACGVTRPGTLAMIMGTSLCHMLLGGTRQLVEGVAGVVEDGIVAGTWGYEAGQAAVGDLFAWFFRCFGREPNEITAKAAALRAGESGLVALDWWNGNRSVLMDADLSGLLAGMTLATRPEEIYRALVEATAFGTLTIIRAFEQEGVPIERLVACGGLAQNSPLVMQVFADVTNRPIALPRTVQASGLGAAMHGAVAAGVFPDIHEAAARMAGGTSATYTPDASAHAVYQKLYGEYQELHDHFGRGGSGLMRRLRGQRNAAPTQRAGTA